MTAKQALAERARLEKERIAAAMAVDSTRVELARLEGEQARVDSERVAAYQRLARGHTEGQAAVDEAEERRSDLLAGIDRERAANTGAHAARKAVEAELEVLLREELPVFAAEAERLTQRAAEAVRAVEAPYLAAQVAWAAAASAWAPLQPAVHATLESVQDEVGVWRPASVVHEAARVPAFPLIAPEEWAKLAVARPPGMRPDTNDR